MLSLIRRAPRMVNRSKFTGIRHIATKNTSSQREKFAIDIDETQCRRETGKYVTDYSSFIKNTARHAWCGRYCQEFCIRSASEDCVNEHPSFCEENCKNECYHTGSPVPYKPEYRE